MVPPMCVIVFIDGYHEGRRSSYSPFFPEWNFMLILLVSTNSHSVTFLSLSVCSYALLHDYSGSARMPLFTPERDFSSLNH